MTSLVIVVVIAGVRLLLVVMVFPVVGDGVRLLLLVVVFSFSLLTGVAAAVGSEVADAC